MDKTNVEAILQWTLASSLKQLREFFCLSGYYRHFIHRYAHISKPLTNLLKKDDFHWTSQAEEAFHYLKMAITSTPVLKLPNFSQTFVLKNDTFGFGIGAVLTQCDHPISYFSKRMTIRIQQQSVYVWELYAIIEVIGKFMHYLIGHTFTIRICYKILENIMQEREDWSSAIKETKERL